MPVMRMSAEAFGKMLAGSGQDAAEILKRVERRSR